MFFLFPRWYILVSLRVSPTCLLFSHCKKDIDLDSLTYVGIRNQRNSSHDVLEPEIMTLVLVWSLGLVSTRWWQLKYFWNFHPDTLGKMIPPTSFSRGLTFNKLFGQQGQQQRGRSKLL